MILITFSGFSIRLEVGGTIVEVGGERGYSRHRRDLLGGPRGMLTRELLKSEPLKVHFLHSGARIRSFLSEPYMLYFLAFYSLVLIMLQTK